MAIEQLSRSDQVTNSTYFAININGQDFRVSSTELSNFVLGNAPSQSGFARQFVTQYASPSSTGFSVQITNDDDNIHLILTPTAGFAAGTIVLPTVTNVIDKQEVLVNCTQQVTALTINGNGAGAVTGEPSSLAADSFFRLKFDLPTSTWFRIG